jgi:hypothetical protein
MAVLFSSFNYFFDLSRYGVIGIDLTQKILNELTIGMFNVYMFKSFIGS